MHICIVCVQDTIKAFEAGQALPNGAKVWVDRVYMQQHNDWKKSQEKAVTKICPVKEARKRRSWCGSVQVYVKVMNEIITVDQRKVATLVQDMHNELKPAADIAKVLTTSLFMSNRLAFCPLVEDVLRPAKTDGASLHWYKL